MINKQEIFNLVKLKALVQNQKCGIIFDNGTRIYPKFHHEGLKCNLGWLIPENDYIPEFEENSDNGMLLIDSKVGKYFLSKGYSEEDFDFLWELQEIHDGVNVDEWELAFNQLAEEYGLNK
jgi:hypothetical protein